MSESSLAQWLGVSPENPGAGPGSPCACQRRPPPEEVRGRGAAPAADLFDPSGIRTPGRPRPNLRPRNLQCFLRLKFKNIVFYDVSGPWAATDFILAMFKNIDFYVVLGSRKGLG